MRDVDDLLTTLDEQPLPPAPGAAAARARGDALRRRGRVLTATATIAAVALVGVSAVALTRGGAEQRLQPTAPTSNRWAVASAYLTPGEASAAESPGFENRGFKGDSELVLDPCGEGEDEVAGAEDASLASFGSDREHGGSSLAQRVARFADDATARRAAQAYLDRVDRCPVVADSPMGPESETRYTVVKRVGDLDRGVFAALVRSVPCQAEGVCAEHFAVYAMVVRSRNGVLVAEYMIAEDGDPREAAERLLDAMAAKLAATTG